MSAPSQHSVAVDARDQLRSTDTIGARSACPASPLARRAGISHAWPGRLAGGGILNPAWPPALVQSAASTATAARSAPPRADSLAAISSARRR